MTDRGVKRRGMSYFTKVRMDTDALRAWRAILSTLSPALPANPTEAELLVLQARADAGLPLFPKED